MKNIEKIVKLSEFGIISIFGFCLFIFYVFYDNIYIEETPLSAINDHLFTGHVKDLALIGGNCALAFHMHTEIT